MAGMQKNRVLAHRIAYRPAEAADAIGCSLTTIYKLHRDGHLPFHKVGGNTFVLADELAAMIRGQINPWDAEKTALTKSGARRGRRPKAKSAEAIEAA